LTSIGAFVTVNNNFTKQWNWRWQGHEFV